MPDPTSQPASISFEGVIPPGSEAKQAALAKNFDSLSSPATPAPSTEENQQSANQEIDLAQFEDNDVQITKPATTDTEIPAEGMEDGEGDKREADQTPTFEIEKPKEEIAKPSENPPFRPAKRDYTKYDPDDVPTLKKLPNSQFAVVEKFALAKAELKSQLAKVSDDIIKLKSGNLPDSWQEHPESYTLTKEYKDLSMQLTYDNFEEQHWTDQLRNIKSGKDWYDIKGYDEENGQPVYELRKALEEGVDFNAEILVSKYLNNVNANKSNRFSQINRLAGAHQQFHNQAISSLKEAENKFFPSWTDPTKIPPESKKNMDLVVQSIHPAFRNHPSTPLLAKSYAYIHQLINHIKQLEQEKKLANDKVQDRIKAGPSNQRFAGVGQTNGGSKTISLADFE